MSAANSTTPHHGFHCEDGVCYRTLDFLDAPGYRIGDDGSVWTCWKRGGGKGSGKGSWVMTGVWKPMKLNVAKSGHLSLHLRRAGVRVSVHVLVLSAFVGPCPPGMEACHDPDPNPANNNVWNLRWDTRKNNHADKIKHGTAQRGENHNMVKLTEVEVRRIRSRREGGESIASLALAFHVSEGNVSFIVKGATWKHIL